MKLFKITIVLFAALALSMPTWAGNIPEFDAVGLDSANVFAVTNIAQYGQVIQLNTWPLPNGAMINVDSDFTQANFPVGFPGLGAFGLFEAFITSAGQLNVDPCFGRFGQYQSAMIDAWNEATYEWLIVLQMKPETDINLNIYDCVLKHNTFNLWGDAEQTGRYRAPWGQLFFTPNQNPIISVKAWPGEYPTPGFEAPFTMDARTLPGLDLVPLTDAFYTSKALWSEGIIMVMPETGVVNESGETMYALKQGDVMQVQVYVNPNPTDIFYGQDNVILKYVGIVGTHYLRSKI
jgi:hypothetical protein